MAGLSSNVQKLRGAPHAFYPPYNGESIDRIWKSYEGSKIVRTSSNTIMTMVVIIYYELLIS